MNMPDIIFDTYPIQDLYPIKEDEDIYDLLTEEELSSLYEDMVADSYLSSPENYERNLY